jgi:hypothetical protein
LALLVIVISQSRHFGDFGREAFSGDRIKTLAGEYLDSTKEIDTIKMHHKIDHVAATLTLTTIKNAFLFIDGETISAITAARTRADHFLALALKTNPALLDDLFDWYGASGVQPRRVRPVLKIASV